MHVSLCHSSLLEEVNVRSNLALEQKRFLNELEGVTEEDELEQEFVKMSAQVVSCAGTSLQVVASASHKYVCSF